ncbi:hypothetical protein RCH17_002804 [Arthrobacter sp. MP_M7]|nr:hypothetical protein [Arthrobacter sp. MP_M4]MEC5203988.1 hypothetical protein [Arthrobacter sp. MP_M7]
MVRARPVLMHLVKAQRDPGPEYPGPSVSAGLCLFHGVC